MSASCSSCRHWTPPSDRDGFGDALTLNVEPPSRAYESAREATVRADQLFGICGAIVLNDDLTTSSLIPLATVRDGSDYRATLYTQAEFGCAMHEAGTSEVDR